MQLLAKFKKILYMEFRATLNFRKFKVALNSMHRIFLNFAKSCILSCLHMYQNSIIRKNFIVPFLKYKRLKLKLRVFLAGQCYYGNLLCHENNTNVFSSDWAFF